MKGDSLSCKAYLQSSQCNARDSDKTLRQQYADVMPHLENLFAVYKTLHALRIKRGAIDFELPETKIIFGQGSKIERIVAMERNEAHRLIEECMLCANICAARFLLENECPGLFRIHEVRRQKNY